MRWKQHQQWCNTPEICDYLLGGRGETTKDPTHPLRCRILAEWERGHILACSRHAMEDLERCLARAEEDLIDAKARSMDET